MAEVCHINAYHHYHVSIALNIINAFRFLLFEGIRMLMDKASVVTLNNQYKKVIYLSVSIDRNTFCENNREMKEI